MEGVKNNSAESATLPDANHAMQKLGVTRDPNPNAEGAHNEGENRQENRQIDSRALEVLREEALRSMEQSKGWRVPTAQIPNSNEAGFDSLTVSQQKRIDDTVNNFETTPAKRAALLEELSKQSGFEHIYTALQLTKRAAGARDSSMQTELLAAAVLADKATAKQAISGAMQRTEEQNRNLAADGAGLATSVLTQVAASQLLRAVDGAMPPQLRAVTALALALGAGGMVNNYFAGRELTDHNGLMRNAGLTALSSLAGWSAGALLGVHYEVGQTIAGSLLIGKLGSERHLNNEAIVNLQNNWTYLNPDAALNGLRVEQIPRSLNEYRRDPN